MSFDLDDDELKATRRMKKLDKMLEVGEYVRTTEGRIDKVKNLKFDDPQYIECEKGLIQEKIIEKHCKEIIGVIKIGDFVNGRRVLFLHDCHVEIGEDDWTTNEIIPPNDIKEILTKEQYEDNYYKIQ